MIPNTSPPTAASDSTAPIQSRAGGSSSAEPGTTASTPTRASPASATLRPKNDCQAKNSRSAPVTNRPSTAPPPAMPTHTPMALGRSAPENEVVMTDRVVGMIAAAPIPWPRGSR